MRLWPLRRPSGAPSPTSDDLFGTGYLLRRNVEDVLAVDDSSVRDGVVVLHGRLLTEPARALDVLLRRLRPLGYTPFLRPGGDGVILQMWPLVEAAARPRIRVNVLLFVLTCLTTLVAGSGAFLTFDPFAEPWRIASGAPFAATLLAILGTHEFGHYFTARYHRASVSLPYFIPAPPPFLFGTLGAIIRMRSPARDRNALMDIAAAGPLAGLIIAIPAVLLGLEWSTVVRVPPGEHLVFGDSILMLLLVRLKFGPIPPGMDVFIHPVALAGWVGLFVTALNLFPVGQLDGGRIAYALFGPRHRLVGVGTFVALLGLGLLTGAVNWVVWAALLFFLVGFQHSPPLDDVTPLTPGRRAVGVLCLLLLVLLVPPVPIQIG